MDDLTFERDVLARLASETRYPRAPRLAPRVLAAIHQPPPARRAPTPWFALAAAAIAIVAALGVVFAVPRSREAVADFFGVEGSRIDVLPTAPPGTTPTPLPTPQRIEAFATPSSLRDAETRAGFAPALPAVDAEPQVYLLQHGSADQYAVVLHYERFDLWQSRELGFYGKGIPPELVIRDFMLGEHAAVWIEGGNHIVRYVDERGREVAGTARTVDRNTLVWRTPFAFYRLETDLPFEQAVEIAASLP